MYICIYVYKYMYISDDCGPKRGDKRKADDEERVKVGVLQYR